jgi:hypothetical protein
VKSTPPKAESHPNTFAWFVLIQRFSDAARNAWAGATAAAPKGGKAAAAAPAKKEEPKKEAKKDDDEMDLFGDDDEDEVRFSLRACLPAGLLCLPYLIGNLIFNYRKLPPLLRLRRRRPLPPLPPRPRLYPLPSH